MTEKYLMLDLNDSKSEKLSEVLANKTCKKILNLLSENEMSESDIASKLSLPLNTVEYNINKLVDVELIQESKNFFWSVKGKKIKSYKLANKKILISTKSSFKGIVPAVLASGLLAFGIRYYYIAKESASHLVNSFGNERAVDLVTSISAPAADVTCEVSQVANCFGILQQAWFWFLVGSLVGLGLFLLFNKLKGGKIFRK